MGLPAEEERGGSLLTMAILTMAMLTMATLTMAACPPKKSAVGLDFHGGRSRARGGGRVTSGVATR